MYSVLRQCSDLETAKQLHALVMQQGRPDRFTSNLIVQMYGRCGSPEAARAAFHSLIPSPNLYSWTLVLTSYAHNGALRDASDWFHLMPLRDVVAWNTFLAMQATCGGARAVHARMPQWSLASWNALLAALSQAGHLGEARDLFDGAPSRDVITWTCLVGSYSARGLMQGACSMFDRMPQRDAVSWSAMVAAHAHKGDLEGAWDHFHVLVEHHASSSSTTAAANSLMSACGFSGRVEDARRLFMSLPARRTCASWNALLAAYAAAAATATMPGKLTAAEQHFQRMPAHNCVTWTTMLVASPPSHISQVFEAMPQRSIAAWNALVYRLASQGRLREALAAFQRTPHWDSTSWNAALSTGTVAVGELTIPDDLQLNPSTLVSALARQGRVDEASAAFETCLRLQPDTAAVTSSWNSMLTAYAQRGQWKSVLQLAQLMALDGGCRPNYITFICTLAGCARAGVSEQGRHSFHSMQRDWGIRPELDHYWCMLDLLAKSGQLQKAEELAGSLLVQLPQEDGAAAAITCRSLLAACNMHCDLDLGRQVVQHILLSLQAHNPAAPCVLFSNMMYSAAR